MMADRRITTDIGDAVCSVTPITAAEYWGFAKRSLPIFENYWHYLLLMRGLEREAPNFDHPRLYAALKTLFGESTAAYDDYKCSFGYQFLLKLTRQNGESQYALNFNDVKGGISFFFRKILTTPEELEAHKDRSVLDRSVLREPLDDLSREEMDYFTTWFMSFLVGFMESYEEHYKEEFARSLDYCCMVYGFRDGAFFLDEYEDPDEFDAVKSSLSKSGGIPFNRVKSAGIHGNRHTRMAKSLPGRQGEGVPPEAEKA